MLKNNTCERENSERGSISLSGRGEANICSGGLKFLRKLNFHALRARIEILSSFPPLIGLSHPIPFLLTGSLTDERTDWLSHLRYPKDVTLWGSYRMLRPSIGSILLSFLFSRLILFNGPAEQTSFLTEFSLAQLCIQEVLRFICLWRRKEVGMVKRLEGGKYSWAGLIKCSDLDERSEDATDKVLFCTYIWFTKWKYSNVSTFKGEMGKKTREKSLRKH